MGHSLFRKSLIATLLGETVLLVVNVLLEWRTAYLNHIVDPKFQFTANPQLYSFRMHSLVSSSLLFAVSVLPLFFLAIACYYFTSKRNSRTA